jgi:hypothetical protein
MVTTLLLVRYITLDESTLIYGHAVVGHATAAASYYAVGQSGALNVNANATDAEEHCVFYAEDSLAWTTKNEWTSTGDIQVVSQLFLRKSPVNVNYDAAGLLTYGDNHYLIQAKESQYGATSDQVSVKGLGAYGGDKSNW